MTSEVLTDCFFKCRYKMFHLIESPHGNTKIFAIIGNFDGIGYIDTPFF
jgi:hypothetical protein